MADKPAGVVEISDALGRDIDRGKMPEGGLPLEDVLHPSTVAQIYDQAQIAKEPVRAEDLVPISPAEAQARRTQSGETLPSMPVTRRVIPAPYQRPCVTGGRHGKTWQQVPAWKVQPDDMTAAVGKVDRVQLSDGDVTLTGIGGVSCTVAATALVQVFRLAPQA